MTSDAAALAIKSGNACILRCGKEAWRSANAIVSRCGRACGTGLPEAVCLIEDTTHASANALMTAVGYVDLLIPRGGGADPCLRGTPKSPASDRHRHLPHLRGRHRRPDKALDIIENAKGQPPQRLQRRGSLPCALRHRRRVPAQAGPAPRPGPHGKGLPPVELRLDQRAAALIPGTRREKDFDTEFSTTSWRSRSWTAWRKPLATSLSTPPATAKPS